MHPTLSPADQDQLFSDTILVLAAVLFAGAPAFGIAYGIVRRWQLRSVRVFIFSGGVGAGIAALLMMWLGNSGMAFAFCTLVGGFFGARNGGEMNRRRLRKRRTGVDRPAE